MVVVEGKGTVADLVAALQADDTKQAELADNSAPASDEPSDDSDTNQEN